LGPGACSHVGTLLSWGLKDFEGLGDCAGRSRWSRRCFRSIAIEAITSAPPPDRVGMTGSGLIGMRVVRPGDLRGNAFVR
jgi:hypothetical protein